MDRQVLIGFRLFRSLPIPLKKESKYCIFLKDLECLLFIPKPGIGRIGLENVGRAE
jgi:hypothetical protein